MNDRLEALATAWRTDAEQRRRVSPQDASADVLTYCAAELERVVRDVRQENEELSPAEYGALPHVNKSASQVRRWCQHGRIQSRRVGRDYRIKRGTLPPGDAGVRAA